MAQPRILIGMPAFRGVDHIHEALQSIGQLDKRCVSTAFVATNHLSISTLKMPGESLRVLLANYVARRRKAAAGKAVICFDNNERIDNRLKLPEPKDQKIEFIEEGETVTNLRHAPR